MHQHRRPARTHRRGIDHIGAGNLQRVLQRLTQTLIIGAVAVPQPRRLGPDRDGHLAQLRLQRRLIILAQIRKRHRMHRPVPVDPVAMLGRHRLGEKRAIVCAEKPSQRVAHQLIGPLRR